MHHPLAIAGLIANIAASVLLLWFPPKVEYTAEGLHVTDGGSYAELPASGEGVRDNLRRYRVRREGFQFALWLLILGFLLQLLDLLSG